MGGCYPRTEISERNSRKGDYIMAEIESGIANPKEKREEAQAAIHAWLAEVYKSFNNRVVHIGMVAKNVAQDFEYVVKKNAYNVKDAAVDVKNAIMDVGRGAYIAFSNGVGAVKDKIVGIAQAMGTAGVEIRNYGTKAVAGVHAKALDLGHSVQRAIKRSLQKVFDYAGASIDVNERVATKGYIKAVQCLVNAHLADLDNQYRELQTFGKDDSEALKKAKDVAPGKLNQIYEDSKTLSEWKDYIKNGLRNKAMSREERDIFELTVANIGEIVRRKNFKITEKDRKEVAEYMKMESSEKFRATEIEEKAKEAINGRRGKRADKKTDREATANENKGARKQKWIDLGKDIYSNEEKLAKVRNPRDEKLEKEKNDRRADLETWEDKNLPGYEARHEEERAEAEKNAKEVVVEPERKPKTPIYQRILNWLIGEKTDYSSKDIGK